MAVISKDLGAVTAYAAAVNRGYTGTKEEFETLMASYATVAQQAARSATSAGQSATDASQSATDAETAKGTAQAAASSAQTFKSAAEGFAQSAQQSAQSASQSAQNAESAKNTAVSTVDEFDSHAQQALDSVNQAGVNWKSLAQAKALDSEAWAVGKRDGEDVGSSDPAYNNNAKWYALTAATDATTASDAAQTATAKASEAQISASAAAESARTLTIDRTLTQAGQAADAKETGDKIASLEEDFNDFIQKNFIEKTASGIDGVTKLAGISYSVAPSNLPGYVIGSEQPQYDTYYFYTGLNKAIYFKSVNQSTPSYISVTVGYSPSKEWVQAGSSSNNISMQCNTSLRKRNIESNLPISSDPLDVSDAIVLITVPVNADVSFFINDLLSIAGDVVLPLVQTTGQNTAKAMSQKAITDAIADGDSAVLSEIITTTENPVQIDSANAINSYTDYCVGANGNLGHTTGYRTYIFHFAENVEVYTTQQIAEGEEPYLSLAVFDSDQISSEHLISWCRNYNSSTIVPTQSNKLTVTSEQYLAVTVFHTTNTYTYTSDVIKHLNSDIKIGVYADNLLKYHSNNALYIACKVNAGYVVYDFNRYTSQDNNADGWGIQLAYLYDGDMHLVTNITTGGEWECAVHLVDRPDFSGLRAHGSEVYTRIVFIIDGVYYDEASLSQITDWKTFESIIIYEDSTLYDPSDEKTEIAHHWKKYIWKDGKLTIYQKLEWLINDTTTICYLAMLPVAKSVTNQFMDNTNFVYRDLSTGSPSYDNSNCKSVTLYSSGNQTADVCATFSIGEYEAGGIDYHAFLLTDNGGGIYNKCYYIIGANKAITVGEIWKAESIYEWQI